MMTCGTRRFQRRSHWAEFGMMGMRSRFFGPGAISAEDRPRTPHVTIFLPVIFLTSAMIPMTKMNRGLRGYARIKTRFNRR